MRRARSSDAAGDLAHAGLHPFGRPDHALQRAVEEFDRGVEVALQLRIVDWQRLGHAIGKVLLGEPVEATPEGSEHHGAFLADRGLFGSRAAPPRPPADPDDEVHFEENGLDHGRDGAGRRVGLLRRAAPPPLLRPGLAQDRSGEKGGEQTVAADIPARLQSDALMRQSDASNALYITLIEYAGGDVFPVGHLRGLGALDRRFVGKQRAHRGGCANDVVEMIEAVRQFPSSTGFTPFRLAEAAASISRNFIR